MQPDAEKRPEYGDLEAALAGERGDLGTFLAEVHPADLAEWLEELDDYSTGRVLQSLQADQLREVLHFAEDPLSETLLQRMGVPQIVEIVEEMPADEVVDLLALTDERTAEQVLRSVDFERAEGLRQLASYDADSAGGLMTTDFVAVPLDSHVGDAIKEIKAEGGPASEEEVGVFVVDDQNRPVGFVSDRELLTTPIHTPIGDVMETDLITVPAHADQEEVGMLVAKYDLAAIPVVDRSGGLVGVVSSEDALDVRHEEAEEDILRLIGTSPTEQQTRLPVLTRVRHRLPLMALTVAGGLLTAFILDQALSGGGASSTGDILRYLPIIIGLAGNVGIQSSTILVRAFATGELSQDRELSVLGSEVLVGTLIGIICGGTTLLVAGVMEGTSAPDFRFGAAVGVAIAVAVTWAALLGCVVPIACNRLGIDPAIVAGPFLITLSDVSGAAIFVGVAYVALGSG